MTIPWTEDWYRVLYYRRADGRKLTYGREYYGAEPSETPERWTATIVPKLREVGVRQGESVLVLGAGFGWLCEALMDDGNPVTAGVEFSPYIAERWEAEVREDVTLLLRDARKVDDVEGALQSRGLPTAWDWVVTEYMVSTYTTTLGRDRVLDAAENYLQDGRAVSHVVHLCSRPGTLNPVFYDPHPEGWEIVRPSHTWLDDSDLSEGVGG